MLFASLVNPVGAQVDAAGAPVQAALNPTLSFNAEGGQLTGFSSSQRASVTSAAARSGGFGLDVSSTAQTAYARWDTDRVPQNNSYASLRFAVRLDSRTRAQSVDLVTVANSNYVRNFDLFITNGTPYFKWDIFSANADQSNFVVQTGRWYLIEVLVEYSGNQHSAQVRIDGVDQGTVTSSGSDATISTVTFGSFSRKTHSRVYDDIALFVDDSPLGFNPDAGGGGGGPEWVTHTGNSAGWVLIDGTRQWFNATCRARLEAAGATFRLTPWVEISTNPTTNSPKTCAELQALLGDGPPPAAAVEFVTDSPNSTAGWVLTGGTRQWLRPSCRSQLEAAGATFRVTTWAAVSASPSTASPQSCTTLENQIDGNPPQAQGALFETAGNPNGGFWIEDGQRQWLNASCMNQLKAAGATVTAVPWSQIANNPDNPRLTTCAAILAGI